MNVSLPNAQMATHKINDRPKDKIQGVWAGGSSGGKDTTKAKKV